MKSNRQVLIGLVGVGPLPGSKLLGQAQGAYVNALAWATTVDDFKIQVDEALSELGLFVIEFEDVESFEERAGSRVLDDCLHALAVEVRQSKLPRFATFHTFAKLDS